MSQLLEREVTIGGSRCRVWEMGSGPRLGFLAGFRGVPRWRPFLDRLAAQRTVVVPSLPGFPGAEAGHLQLDDTADWISMTLDVIDAAGLEGADLIGESVGGMLAAEAAAFSPRSVSRLVLINSLGLYDVANPVRNPYQTQALQIPAILCADLEKYNAAIACQSADPVEFADWEVMLYRADESAARLIWPFAERGLGKRLHRIRATTLILSGEQDRIVPRAYADRFAAGIAGPSRVMTIPKAGHLLSIDAPEVADSILTFLA